MPIPPLPARFVPPAVRAGLVPRSALVHRLIEGQQTRVVAVVAPPGYGKTTVLAQWAARDPRPFAWLSVDRRSNDPVVLLSSVAVALARVVAVAEAIFDHLVAPHRLQREAVVAGLASAVDRAGHPFVFVLDDAHLLTDPEGLAAVRSLLEHLPAGSQLAVCGRREPPLRLARLRGEGRVLDLGPEDLRLDAVGAQELLAAAGAGQLSDDDLDALLAATEGWPIGLYFAALARRSVALPLMSPREFAGDDRLLADYIRTELLDRLPADRLRFLIRTSILDELSGPLCDAVVQRTGSAAELEEIEASNLLLVPLDRQRSWYRYHHLFGALLRHELERTEPDAIPELALRASRWCEANDLIEAAAQYAQLAGDVGRVNEILVRTGMQQLARGRLAALRAWLAWLTQQGHVDAGVAVIAACFSHVVGLPAEADRWVATARAGDPTVEQPDGSPLEGWVLTASALLAGDADQMRRDAEGALQLLAPTSPWRARAVALRGDAAFLGGDLDTADRYLDEAVEVGTQAGAPNVAASALIVRALIAIRQDRWQAADALLARAASVIEAGRLHRYPWVALSHALRARVAVHDQDLDTARTELQTARGLLPPATRALAALTVPARLELARVALGLGDLASAETGLTDVQQLLAGNLNFPSLQDDADELAAAIRQLRGSAAGPAPLTPAELRLLPLLATHRSRQEIANDLFLSVHTVKTQVASIYRKLDVSSRTQAVHRGRSLGLLTGAPTPPSGLR